ncbi:MAG: F0F1 ATP synthase subunit A [Bacteroides sp.]|jgi:F-type H+-transporting ATPase subunit a|nr:F0F1 ATP synthase subunit A [Bacteroides sp.]MCI1682965.1 F0F1 ATP synthase subunit A [Bacteroides sp.]
MKQLRNLLIGGLWVLGLCVALPLAAQSDSTSQVTSHSQPPISAVKATVVEGDTASTQKDREESTSKAKNPVDVKGLIFGHIGDAYEWHITTWGHTKISIPLPVIIYSERTGWHVFLASRLEENGGIYEGLSIAPEGSKYEGKLVEHDEAESEIRPWDISITKVSFALLFNSALLIIIVLSVAGWYRRHPKGDTAPGGFVGMMEMFIMAIHDDVIKNCVGSNYHKYAPYLLTAFFFILINNLMGIVPFFPGGANVTGNIAITFVLALCTFFAVNLFGTKTYWKDIFWPDVPWWLKVPIPMMPFIELFGIFTKPFALMIRLFANMLAGHMAMLVLTSLVFISVSMGPVVNGTLTITSVAFNIFMNALEVLVAFIQAYVFTLLSAIFIGLAQENNSKKESNLVVNESRNEMNK